MEEKNYHHGNLRIALIEAGIAIVNEEGMESCSLRKVAAKCGVSHAAPYSHFKDKEDLIEAMKVHVTDRFTGVLLAVVKKYEGDKMLITKFGKAYVLFFCENPNYFTFIFGQRSFQVNLTEAFEETESYPPFEIFKKVSMEVMNKLQIPKEKHLQTLIAMWAVVHGAAAIATMGCVEFHDDWGIMIENILCQNMRLGKMAQAEESNANG